MINNNMNGKIMSGIEQGNTSLPNGQHLVVIILHYIAFEI